MHNFNRGRRAMIRPFRTRLHEIVSPRRRECDRTVPHMRVSEEAVMRAMLGLVFSLTCAACAVPAPAPPPSIAATPQSAVLVSASPPPQNCREYTTPVLVGGKDETASGVACEQGDGSWRITDNTPGLPQRVYTMPPPGTVAPLPGPAPGQVVQGQVVQGQADCREYTVPIIVGGAQKQGVGESCRQPDGSWRITDNTPGLPQQVYVVPPPYTGDYSAYDPWASDPWAYDPWIYGPPVALAGSFVFADGFHRFHHFHRGPGPFLGFGHHH
jgi:surface antigen